MAEVTELKIKGTQDNIILAYKKIQSFLHLYKVQLFDEYILIIKL